MLHPDYGRGVRKSLLETPRARRRSRALDADAQHKEPIVMALMVGTHCNLEPMRYWGRLPPPPRPPRTSRYITFELDSGGWNNVRMALETIFALAFATNRTLVLPPAQEILYMTVHDLSQLVELNGVNVMTMADFLRQEALRLGLGREETHALIGGLQQRAIRRLEHDHPLWKRLRTRARIPPWGATNPSGPPACLLVGAPSKTSIGADRAFCEGRAPFRPHEPWNDPWLLHLPCTRPPERLGWYRLFGHFYTLTGDERMNRRLRALVRDGVRYARPLMCAAASAIAQLKRECGGSFASMHARQGDFQRTRPRETMQAGDIERALASDDSQRAHAGTRSSGREGESVGECLFIASDAPKSTFASLERGAWRPRYLSDGDLARHGVSKALSGLVEQLVAAHGHSFYGTKLSTFSHLIFRLRGYYNLSQRSWLLVPSDPTSRRPASLEKLRTGKPVAPYWHQEWPVAWDVEPAQG